MDQTRLFVGLGFGSQAYITNFLKLFTFAANTRSDNCLVTSWINLLRVFFANLVCEACQPALGQRIGLQPDLFPDQTKPVSCSCGL